MKTLNRVLNILVVSILVMIAIAWGIIAFTYKNEADYEKYLEDMIVKNFEVVKDSQGNILVDKTAELVNQKIEYDLDYKYVSLERSIQEGKGVCKHYADIMMALLRNNKIEAKYIIGKNSEVNKSHVWISYKRGNEWKQINVTGTIKEYVSDGEKVYFETVFDNAEFNTLSYQYDITEVVEDSSFISNV